MLLPPPRAPLGLAEGVEERRLDPGERGGSVWRVRALRRLACVWAAGVSRRGMREVACGRSGRQLQGGVREKRRAAERRLQGGGSLHFGLNS